MSKIRGCYAVGLNWIFRRGWVRSGQSVFGLCMADYSFGGMTEKHTIYYITGTYMPISEPVIQKVIQLGHRAVKPVACQ